MITISLSQFVRVKHLRKLAEENETNRCNQQYKWQMSAGWLATQYSQPSQQTSDLDILCSTHRMGGTFQLLSSLSLKIEYSLTNVEIKVSLFIQRQ